MTHKSTESNIQDLELELVYNKLVKTDTRNNYDSLVGKIAYTQYVIQKNQYIKNNIEENGCNPSDEEILTIIKYFNRGNAINELKDTAKSELDNYINSLAHKEIKTLIKSNYGFISSIVSNILATFIYSTIIALIIFTYSKEPNSTVAKIINIITSEDKIDDDKANKASNKHIDDGRGDSPRL